MWLVILAFDSKGRHQRKKPNTCLSTVYIKKETLRDPTNVLNGSLDPPSWLWCRRNFRTPNGRSHSLTKVTKK